MKGRSKIWRVFGFCLMIIVCLLIMQPQVHAQQKVGVLYIVHGGFDQYSSQNLWDSSAHIFAVRPDHPVHKWVLFNSAGWSEILQAGNAPKEIGKYSFEYERIGGLDPFTGIVDSQISQLQQQLNERACSGCEYVVDYTGWIAPERIEQFPYPRFLYTAPDYIAPFPLLGQTAETISGLTYCGEDEADGPWADCDPERYNVDGPAERFIAAGVDKIIVVDYMMGGPRFFKTHDAITLFKMALADNGGGSIPVTWVNDPNDLMENSLPTAPTGNWGTWNPDKGVPTAEPSIPLASNPNPVAEDDRVATMYVESTEASFNPAVPDSATAVLIIDHAIRDYGQYYDPKIDDTLIINKKIKTMLLNRHPDMNPDNIIGAYMGIQEDGSAEGYAGKERTRAMRGENLGHAWLYESTSVPGTYAAKGLLPGDEWGYKYWDALEILKNNGVEHIVICFTHIVADSVLNMVEIPNQVAKEIGYKNWLKWGTWDYESYPGVGHPFADYWGIWVNTQCDDGAGGVEDCCFEMGGCADGRPYPPPRQTTEARDDLDPSLAYDVSEYGHLGYDPGLGAPDPNAPVQNQYTGTWAMYQPPNDDIRIAEMLADYVLDAVDCFPIIEGGPFVAGGTWPLLSSSQESPTYMSQNYSVLWTFSDDFSSCEGACTHSAEYQAVGGDTWTPVSVSSDAENGYAWAALPVTGLVNATTYAFRFTVTDCAEQTTQSSTFYFRTAVTDAAPVLTGGPFVAAGTWPRLATTAAGAFEVSADFQALWTFSDDYASCAGVCRHIARYRNAADAGWDWIGLTPVSTDAAGTQYAYVTIPVGTDDLAPGTYMLQTVTWDCLQQTTWSRIYYFKVAP